MPSLVSFLIKRLWWAHVTVTPLLRSTAVFNSGTARGSKGDTPTGGHIAPTSGEGTLLWWKKAQNQAQKNKTSLKINNAIPHLSPSWTLLLWSPPTPSRETSRHQRAEKKVTKNKLNKKNVPTPLLNQRTNLLIKLREEAPTNNGQGLKVTKWKEWKWIYSRISASSKLHFHLS